MKNILTVIKKELKAVFSNKRLFFSIVIMPGLLIFIMYTIMGKAIQGRYSGDSDKYSLAILNDAPDNFESMLPDKFEIEYIDNSKLDEYKTKVYDGDLDLILHFDDQYSTKINNKESFDVTLYYNPSESVSETAYQTLSTILSAYQSEVMKEVYGASNVFTINQNKDIDFELYDEDKANAMAIAMVLPFLLMSLMFSAAMSVTPESISGEKERGTLATLLVTQVKRSEIAIGKIISLSILASLSGISSFIGTISSMPSLMGTGNLSYGFSDYAFLLLTVLTTVLLITGLLSLLSAYAKTVKEASLLASPLMILSMVLGLSSMFTDSIPTNHFIYFIPLYNSVEALVSILSMEVNYVNIVITLVSNLIYTGACVFILSKMFNNEKIMFSR